MTRFRLSLIVSFVRNLSQENFVLDQIWNFLEFVSPRKKDFLSSRGEIFS